MFKECISSYSRKTALNCLGIDSFWVLMVLFFFIGGGEEGLGGGRYGLRIFLVHVNLAIQTFVDKLCSQDTICKVRLGIYHIT